MERIVHVHIEMCKWPAYTYNIHGYKVKSADNGVHIIHEANSLSLATQDPHICTYVWTPSVPHTHIELHGTLGVGSRSPQPSPERRWIDL